MRNTNLTIHSDRELELWIDNDEYLHQEWRKTIRLGNMAYIESALEAFTYTKAQWEHLVDCFEEELAENTKALEARNPA